MLVIENELGNREGWSILSKLTILLYYLIYLLFALLSPAKLHVYCTSFCGVEDDVAQNIPKRASEAWSQVPGINLQGLNRPH